MLRLKDFWPNGVSSEPEASAKKSSSFEKDSYEEKNDYCFLTENVYKLIVIETNNYALEIVKQTELRTAMKIAKTNHFLSCTVDTSLKTKKDHALLTKNVPFETRGKPTVRPS